MNYLRVYLPTSNGDGGVNGGVIVSKDSSLDYLADTCYFGCVTSHIDSESGIVGGDFDSVVV